jgi:DNA-binding NarL/FixJ family response regulator
MSLRILLCDDTAELRSLLRSALENQDEVTIVGEAGDGNAALAAATDAQPDVIVLDLEMPGPPAATLLVALRRAAPRARIATFSGHDPSAVVGGAVREIALHLPKTTELTAAARAVCDLGRHNTAA